MIKEFIEKWNKYNKELEKYFKNTEQKKYSEYKDIIKSLFEIVINRDEEFDCDKFDTENILVIDDGNYQGTQIFILHKDTYQPSIEEYVYTNTYYGSCSGCDTLLNISSYDDGLPTEEQVKDYMQLALHLLQRFKYMEEKNKELEKELGRKIKALDIAMSNPDYISKDKIIKFLNKYDKASFIAKVDLQELLKEGDDK